MSKVINKNVKNEEVSKEIEYFSLYYLCLGILITYYREFLNFGLTIWVLIYTIFNLLIARYFLRFSQRIIINEKHINYIKNMMKFVNICMLILIGIYIYRILTFYEYIT